MPLFWSQALICLIFASASGLISFLGFGPGTRAYPPSPLVMVLVLLPIAFLVFAPVAGLIEVLWATMRGERVVLAVLRPLHFQRSSNPSTGWTIRLTRIAEQNVIYDLSDYPTWARATQRSYRWFLAGTIVHVLLLLVVTGVVVTAQHLPPMLVAVIAPAVAVRLALIPGYVQHAVRGMHVLKHPGSAQSRYLAREWIASATFVGIPPTSWHADIVATLTRFEEETDDALAWYYAYVHAAAIGDIDAARHALEMGLAAVRPVELSVRYLLCIESAFLEAWHYGNSVRARQWLNVLPMGLLFGRPQLARAKAAILLVEGQFAEGLVLARKALQLVQATPPGAVAPADAVVLNEMIARAEARLALA